MDDKLIKMADDLEAKVDEYANKIINNEIKSCQKMKYTCMRYFDFKEKYDFDKIELLKFYIWSNQFKYRTGTKGIKGQRIELHESLLFDAANILCIKKDDGNRLYKKAYIQKARKNVKTMFMALISSYIAANTDDEQQEIYIAGWDKQQSEICYREINFQLETSEKIKGKYKNSYGKITFLNDGSFIKPLSREARNTGDGTNPSVGIIDEYHAHKTSEIYDVLDSGMAARDNGLMVIITTPGFNITYPCYKEYQYTSKILDPNVPDVVNDSYYICIYEMEANDDIKDESNWIKSNPVVATYNNGIEYLRGKLQELLDAPEKKRNVLTKNFGMWVDMKEDGYLDMSKWREAEEEVTLFDFIHCDCVLGIDLSNKLDLTSVAFEFYKDDKFYIFQHSWIPQENYEKRMREGKYRFDMWVEEGNLTIIPGASVDYNAVRNYIKQIEEDYGLNIIECVYDPWNASQFVQNMYEEGYIMVEMRQGALTMNEPTKDFRERIYNKELIHSKDGLLTWAASNAVAVQNSSEYTKVDKKMSNDKIDPIVACICAHYRGMKILADTGETFCYSPPI